MLDPKMFIWLLQPGDLGITESLIVDAQNQLASVMDNWNTKEPFWKTMLENGQCLWTHPHTNKLVIPPDQSLYQTILKGWHDMPTAGHLGRDETTCRILEFYHWPNVKVWIMQYIQGCATCQQNKNVTYQIKVPLYHIMTREDAKPFEQVAMDLITDLLLSQRYDTVLTIVDHGCSHTALFLPC